MTPEERALRAAFLAEMWPVCREESREERAAKRALDEVARDACSGGFDGKLDTSPDVGRPRGAVTWPSSALRGLATSDNAE